MATRDFELLARFWTQEPWGPQRDNLHAAIIAREVRRPYLKDPSKNELHDFMLTSAVERAQANAAKARSLVNTLKSIARRRRRENRSG